MKYAFNCFQKFVKLTMTAKSGIEMNCAARYLELKVVYRAYRNRYKKLRMHCPSRPLAELWWEVEECETDTDCWPRICCPDGRKRYCRTSQPELDTVPESVQRSFNYLTDYLECTPPPPPIFDLHPKVCTSTLDCFPNVCCQEAGLRHCRPPKKSVFTMLANVFNVDFVKRLTQNIVIK
ncbi:hypothetical protein GQX74_006420 [Glossina fuscipes]|nr:hypothetical protein GQX74_006420 [Glossina fuscipes]